MIRMIKIAIPFLCFILFSAAAQAFDVRPIILELAETGRDSTGTYRVTNTHEQPLTLEVGVLRRVLQADGSEQNVEDNDNFVVIPPQAMIKPGRTQVFRVRYIGDEALSETAGFRTVFRQLPVDMEPSQETGVRFLMNVRTLLFITPPGVSPEVTARISFDSLHNEVRFDATEYQIDLTNEQGVLVIANNGTGVQDLELLRFRIETDNGQSVVLEWEDIRDAVNMRYVLPGRSSRIPIEALALELEGTVSGVAIL